MDGYMFPPQYIQKNLFQKEYFYTDGQIDGLLKDRALFGMQFHARIMVCPNPFFTWVWAQEDIDEFWKKI